jgi:hypothetical protein
MRQLKLSLVFLGAVALSAIPLAAQTAPATPEPGGELQIAPAPPVQSPFHYPQNGHVWRFTPDQSMNLRSRLMTDRNPVCMKLRKYIFHRSDGGDAMRPVGETDCTYSSKVWPKSADGAKPQPQFGLQSAVVRQK